MTMNQAQFHKQLLDRLTAELAAVGYTVTKATRRQMERVLAYIDRKRTIAP
jgi:hypothetical protein